MLKNRTVFVSIFLNVIYGIVLLNIASVILLAAYFFKVPYELSLVIVIAFFILEFILFFSDILSPGIFVLSFISVIPYVFVKKIKYTEISDVSKRLKKGILNISEELMRTLLEKGSLMFKVDKKV